MRFVLVVVLGLAVPATITAEEFLTRAAALQPQHDPVRTRETAGFVAVFAGIGLSASWIPPRPGTACRPAPHRGGFHQTGLDPAPRRSTPMATTTDVASRQTYKDYCATPDDERYELIDGRLMMVPAPNMKHQEILGRLYPRTGPVHPRTRVGQGVRSTVRRVPVGHRRGAARPAVHLARARAHRRRAERAGSARPGDRDTLAVHRREGPGLQARAVRETRACSSTGSSIRWPRPSPSTGKGTAGSNLPRPLVGGIPCGRRCSKGCSSSSTTSSQAEQSPPRFRLKRSAGFAMR